MDPDETPEACALRELREETGYMGELVADQSVSHIPHEPADYMLIFTLTLVPSQPYNVQW